MSKHTPLPWWNAKTGSHQGLVISEENGANVAVTYNGDSDAEFIVRACNCHDELLAACKYVLEEIYKSGWPCPCDSVRAAIAAAEGTQQ